MGEILIDPFARPKPVFNERAYTNIVAPDAEPVASVPVPCVWLPWVIGALKTLRQQATWQDVDAATMTEQLQSVDALIGAFTQSLAEPPCVIPGVFHDCEYDFSIAESGWFPLDPYHGVQCDYVGGTGFVGGCSVPENVRIMDIGSVYDPPINRVTQLVLNATPVSDWGGGGARFVRFIDPFNTLIAEVGIEHTGDTFTDILDGPWDNVARIEVYIDTNGLNTGDVCVSNALISLITVSGYYDDSFIC